MEVWYKLYGAVIVLLTLQCVAAGRNAAYSGWHPKRSQENEESSSDGMLDIYKTAKQLEELHETLQDVIKVLDIIGKKEEEILDVGEGKEQSAPADDDTRVHLSLINPEADTDTEKATPSKLDIDTSVLGLQLARILSQKEDKDKIIQTSPETIPAKKSMIVDPQPRRADTGEDDDRMFKRILAKYMQHQLEKDDLQLM